LLKTLKLSPLSQAETYDCQFDWPDNCPVQAGDSGVVFVQGGHSYTTAFFEAFPPDTFIRGEGATVALAELDAWQQFSKIRQCAHPEFERRGYENGAGFCVQCGMFQAHVFPPSKTCVVCGVPTYWTLDTDGNAYCQTHAWQKPLDKWTRGDWFLAYDEYEMWMEQWL